MRVHELAKELGVNTKVIMDLLASMKVQAKSHSSTLDEATVERVRRRVKGHVEAKPAEPGRVATTPSGERILGMRKIVPPPPPPEPPAPDSTTVDTPAIGAAPAKPAAAEPPVKAKPAPPEIKVVPRPVAPPVVPAEIEVAGPITVGELAAKLGLGGGDVVKRLLEQGVLAGINHQIGADVAAKVAEALGSKIRRPELTAAAAALSAPRRLERAKDDAAVARPPVVTVMGHVDHGKTSLLDAIRQTDVATREFGGITQHIGASTVEVGGKRIVFIDTPGHEAFTTLRARGAQVTDIAVLVVAADDGVMPQTVEALNHAKAAGVPVIVAINKVDLPQANPDRVKQQLSDLGLVPEDWGGDTVTLPVSARTQKGIKELLELILLVSDMQELRANPARPARGTIVEARLDRGRGPVATVLVQEGTLRMGGAVVAGSSYGRVRPMTRERGKRVAEANPATTG